MAERPWPFRRNTGLGGASWAATMHPSCRTDSRPSQCFQDLHGRPGIAGAFRPWQQLKSMQLEPHCVVLGHLSAVFEAQDLLQAQLRVERPECRLRVLRRNLEAPVEPRRELLQHPVGFPYAVGFQCTGTSGQRIETLTGSVGHFGSRIGDHRRTSSLRCSDGVPGVSPNGGTRSHTPLTVRKQSTADRGTHRPVSGYGAADQIYQLCVDDPHMLSPPQTTQSISKNPGGGDGSSLVQNGFQNFGRQTVLL